MKKSYVAPALTVEFAAYYEREYINHSYFADMYKSMLICRNAFDSCNLVALSQSLVY